MGPPSDEDRPGGRQEQDSGGRDTPSDGDGRGSTDHSIDRRDRDPPPPPGTPTPDPAHHEPDTRTAADAFADLARDLVVTAIMVGLLVSLLFGASGVWPPLVAVESDSMEPEIMTGDLVFIMDADRLSTEAAIDGTGIVPVERGARTGYETFGGHGDVIIFAPNGNGHSTPIIHRAHLWVEEGENWADRADEDLVSGSATCSAMSQCPAPHAGFITHGDNNRFYDQEIEQSQPVKPEWIIAKAELRVPWLGNVRLLLSMLLAPSSAGAAIALSGGRSHG